jgi:hypothetical protein
MIVSPTEVVNTTPEGDTKLFVTTDASPTAVVALIPVTV